MNNPLIGKTIQHMQIASDKMALLFVTTDGEELIARVDADCCSHTWVESIELPALGFPCVVQAVDDLDLHPDADTQGGELAFYGCKITTDKGDMVIDYRNESNGYYGGSISWPGDDYFYGGVYGQNVSTFEWVEIKDAG
jgi:hypothetical protein